RTEGLRSLFPFLFLFSLAPNRGPSALLLWGLCSTSLPQSLYSVATEVDFGHHKPYLLILPNPSCDHQSYFHPQSFFSYNNC
ncbi:hypothetical protein D0Y65_038958, partial [Glycine soja]